MPKWTAKLSVHAFPPKALLLKYLSLAGLLTYSIVYCLPVMDTVACSINNVMELTATGIVPEFHGIPFSSALCGTWFWLQ